VRRFSVVVPTRDRPDFLDFCLEGLAAQTFDDFEVIVSDNATQAPSREVFERWARPGWRYLAQERPVAMHENFERGCAEATGEYVAVVIDKTVLHPSALEVADRALDGEAGIDIVTWWNEGYDPVDEHENLGQGCFQPSARTIRPKFYDPAAELNQRFANTERRGIDQVGYVRGKIVFGAFSRLLLGRIREQTGRLFYPLAPDYTSMVPACALASGGLDLGRPLLVSYNSMRSNGRMQSIDPAYARRFVEAVDPGIIDALPIPGLYTSPHNVVAYDLVSAAARCPAGTTPPLDYVNLLRRAREDLDRVVWAEPVERDAQYAILAAAENRVDVTPATANQAGSRGLRATLISEIARVPLLARIAYRVAGRAYASPVEAARAADRHYAARVAHS
jgi:glycosyltransferase involved in cell wall biosynthesis